MVVILIPAGSDSFEIELEINISGSIHIITCTIIKLRPCESSIEEIEYKATNKVIIEYEKYLQSIGSELPGDWVYRIKHAIKYKPKTWTRTILNEIFDNVISQENYEDARMIQLELSLLKYVSGIRKFQKWNKTSLLQLMYVTYTGKWVYY